MRALMLMLMLMLSACESRLSACKRAPLESLADQLAAAEPHARPDLLHQQLGEACRLPDAFAGYLEHLAPVGSKLPRQDSRSAVLFLDRDAFAHACAAGKQVFRRYANMDHDERGPYVYETCELARYGLGELDDDIPLMVWALHQWLLDQGLDAERAKAISRAAALSDRRAYADAGTYADLELPQVSDAASTRALGMIFVHVSASALLFDGEQELAVSDGEVPPGPGGRAELPQLEQPLYRASQLDVEPLPVRLDIAADVGTRLHTIEKLGNTAAAVRLRELSLVVETAPFRQAALVFELARADEPVDVRVGIEERGRVGQLCAGGGTQLTVEITARRTDTVEQLAALLGELWSRGCVQRVVLSVA